jgi:hypothetical protein
MKNQKKELETDSTIAGWVVSLSFHALIIFILAVIVIASPINRDPAPVRMVRVDLPPVEPEKVNNIEQTIKDTPFIIEHNEPITSEVTIFTNIDIQPSEQEQVKESEDKQDNIKGREDAVSDSEMGGTNAFNNIGAGGGSSGAFGRKIGGNEKSGYVTWIKDIAINDDGCKNGTFNYPEQKYHGWETSRILNHCYITLSLEVAIRYNPLFK